MKFPIQTTLKQYGWAILLAFVAMLVRFILYAVFPIAETRFLVFSGAITLSAWLGNHKTAFATTVAATLIVDYFFLTPSAFFWNEDVTEITTLGVFLMEGTLIGFIVGSLHQAQKQAEVSHQESLRNQELSRQSELRFQQMVEAVEDYAIFMLDPDGRVVSWNAGAKRIKGYEPEEIIGQHFSRFYPREDIEQGKVEHRLKTAAEKGHFEEEGWRVRKDGSRYWATVVLTALRDNEGRLCGFTKLTRDISERKRLEDALKQRQRQLEAVLLQMPSGVSIAEAPSGKLIMHNEQAVRLLKHPMLESDDYSGYTKYGAMHDENTPYLPEEYPIARAARYGEVITQEEMLYRRGDGSVTWFSVSAAPVVDEQGQILAAVSTFEDISERKLLEEELRRSRDELEVRVQERTAELSRANDRLQVKMMESEIAHEALKANQARFAGIVDLSFDAIITINGAHEITLFNKGAEAIFGYEVDEILGKPLNVLLPKRFTASHAAFVEQFRRAPEYAKRMHNRGEVYGLRKNGEEFPAEASISKITINGETIFTVFLRDISDRKRMEEDLRANLAKEKELSELKSRFTATVSHEFRTPLAVILTSADIITRYSDKLTPQRRNEHLEKIKAYVHHMTRLLETILYVGKAEASGLNFQRAPVDLRRLCLDVVEEMQLIVQPDHEVIFTSWGDCGKIMLDEHLMRLMITNLVGNAVKYSPQNAEVRLSLYCKPQEVIVRVEDNGIGIPEADRKRLFEPYYRATNVGTISGTGLGLSLIHHIVDVHEGTIEVESEVGVGTAMIISLPIVNVEEG